MCAPTWQVSTDGLTSVHLTSKCWGTSVCLGVYLRVYLWFEVDIVILRETHPDLPVTGAPLNPEMTLSFPVAGVPPDPECDHAQSLTGPSAVESRNYEVRATARPAGKSLRHQDDKQLCKAKPVCRAAWHFRQFCTALWGTKYAIKEGGVLFAQLYNLLLPYFRIFQSNLLRSIDHAQYKHYAAFYKSPWLFCLDVPFFRKLMLTFYCYFINSWYLGKKN